MNVLVLVRGLPGSGKTTFAKSLPGVHISADDYFYDDAGNYNFDPTKLGAAHNECQDRVDCAMAYANYAGMTDSRILVHNTFTTEREMKPYFEMAARHNFQVTTIIVENRHGIQSVHNVPEATIDKMRNRFSIQL